MLRLMLAMFTLLVLALPLAAHAGTPTADAPAAALPVSWPVDAYYLLHVRCYARGELMSETEIGVINGAWGEVRNTRDMDLQPEIAPALLLAFKAGHGLATSFDFKHVPPELLPEFKHFRAGELEFWVYAPECDQLEATWSKSDIGTSPLPRSVNPRSLVNEPPQPRMDFQPAGALTVSL